jgi:hypothetical protein
LLIGRIAKYEVQRFLRGRAKQRSMAVPVETTARLSLNLDCCRTRPALVASIEAQEEENRWFMDAQ